MPPKTRPKARECVSPFLQGFLCPPKHAPGFFPGAKVVSRKRNTSLAHGRGSRGVQRIQRINVVKCRSDPPFHMHRGLG